MPLPSGTAAFLGMPLFIRGHMAASGVVHVGPPVHGSGLPDDSPPLFVRGYLPASGQTTLFIHGWSAASGGPPLCEAGHLTAASGAPLYLYGWSTHSGGLPLVVACDAVPALSGGLDLTVTGGAESGFARGIPLHAYSDPSGNVREGRLPLWVGAFGAQRVPRNVNLWVGGENRSAAGGLGLTAWNDQSGVALGTTLVVSGDGTTPGALGHDRALNLSLKRDPGNALPLYLAAPGTPAQSGTTLLVRGHQAGSLGAPLAVPRTVGGPARAVRLFTSGW
jgi:hypothetical protein